MKTTEANNLTISVRLNQISTCCYMLQRCVVGGGNTFFMVVSPKEMARAVCYYLCFSPLSVSPNGICLKLNNSSIKHQVRNKKLNTEPFETGKPSWKMEFQLLEIKSPQQPDGSGKEWEEKEEKNSRRRGKTRKHRSKTEVAGSQSGSYTVNKISPQGA